MKIIDNRSNAKPVFEEYEVGTCFEYDNIIYMKIDDTMACSLGGKPRIDFFDKECVIIPVKVELIIYD